MKKTLYITVGLCAVFLLIFGYRLTLSYVQKESLIWRLDKIYENPNLIIRHFSPTWRSIKKIGDLWYLPRIIFYKSPLPTYEITLSKKDLNDLIKSLPQYEEGERFFTEENKQSVIGRFKYGAFETDAKIRYRGILSNHWNAVKKSWQINLPNEKPLGDQQTIRLFIPEDRWWAAEFLEAYRARKFGVLTPDLEFVKLRVNGRDYGVYMSIEGFDTQFLENNSRVVGEIYNEKDLQKRIDYLQLSNATEWETRINPTSRTHDDALAYFTYVISHTSDEEFARRIPTILDIDVFSGWVLESLLARNYHQKNFGNLNFYFDPSRGIFEPIAYDMFSLGLDDTYKVDHNRLLNRMMRLPPFRKKVEEKAHAYVSNQKNLQEDLEYYDSITNTIAPDIIADTAKLPPTSAFFSYYREHRNVIIENFNKVKSWLENGSELPLTTADETYPLSVSEDAKAKYDFSPWKALILSRQQFVARHPQFKEVNTNSLSIGPGAFAFKENVILPFSVSLIIQPGTHLYFDPNRSLVVSGQIQSIGTPNLPISFEPANEWKPWGGLVIMNTDLQSVFRYTTLKGGGARHHARGVDFENMLSAYQAPLLFENGIIDNSIGNGVGIIQSKLDIHGVSFSNNKKSALALNRAIGKIERAAFYNSEVFISSTFSNLIITNINMLHCTGNGITVGEHSSAVIDNSTIALCKEGLSLRNASNVILRKSALLKNRIAASLQLNEKRFERGPSLDIQSTILWANERHIDADSASKVDIRNSTVEDGYAGTNISTVKPDFTKIIPQSLIHTLRL